MIWWISVRYGAREEGVCWNCFSPLRRGAPTEATPQQRRRQQRRRQQRCGEQRHSNGNGKGILVRTAWHSSIAASFAFFLPHSYILLHSSEKDTRYVYRERLHHPSTIKSSRSVPLSFLSLFLCTCEDSKKGNGDSAIFNNHL